MKKILLLLSIMLLGGCQMGTQEKEDYLYFLFATPLAEHDIWLQAKEGFDDACEDFHVKGDWIGPTVIDTLEMEDVVYTGILQQADGIITQGVISRDIVAYANQKQIPMEFVDSNMENSEHLYYMGKDFKKQAQLLLADIEEKKGKNEPLKVAIQVANLDFQIAKDQIAEVKEVFEQHPGGYEIVNVSESKSEEIRAKKEWEFVMSQHADINVAINFAAESAEFCWEAAMQQGIRDDMLIYGVDDMPITLDFIKEGKIDGSVVTSFYQYGYEGVRILYEYVTTGKKPEHIETNLIIVDKDNINHYRELNDGK
ncbi:sugar ABC transporter substrate-binding protein [Amedibacillus dolichus]|uniref:Sugar ABC transporter substrate-binding protein n=2 Tax=Amedibacillus dolichus TaxID=31971 RepID=A0A415PRE3_9FIRM|nr:sugar ABC transporter substrate-binding protein [Amedibacillus dolichus]